jgi:hypothetical protein
MAEACDSCSVSSADVSRYHHHLRSRGWSKPSIYVLKDLLLLVFAIVGFISLVQSWTSTHVLVHSKTAATGETETELTAVSCSCGSSKAEALTLGCKYDSLAAAWLPEHCRDDELTAEFERSGPGVDGKWTYWTDSAHTKEISTEDIANGADDEDFRFHMSGHWHVIHCIFYWRKEHRARFNGKVVEPRSDSEAHIKHCGEIFLDPGRDTVAGPDLNTDISGLE